MTRFSSWQPLLPGHRKHIARLQIAETEVCGLYRCLTNYLAAWIGSDDSMSGQRELAEYAQKQPHKLFERKNSTILMVKCERQDGID
jgi:hypothetical protein